ncbi:MAG TPA: DDE-type integrase/transposase/recombinase, partial [Gemmataceae bacterium]|nr:DDE-type integrase/transposase/recombinase [Gemmataceae bacterium]
RIKDARMASIPAHHRPFYRPTERLAILELKAARGWSLEQTAKTFFVCPKTIASWIKRLDEDGAAALVQLPVPANKFPDFVRYAVQRLQVLCPNLGKKKLSEVLTRAGLHLGTTTIGRIRREKSTRPPFQPETPKVAATKDRTVTAKHPNHVWHVDLTTVPTQLGFWCPWSPWAWPQCWPWCWWGGIVLDHYSRRVMGFALFRKAPTSVEVRSCLGRAIGATGTAPRYLVSDKGSQFFPTADYKIWCRHHGIRPRFGALGKHGSIAVLERAVRTIKEAPGARRRTRFTSNGFPRIVVHGSNHGPSGRVALRARCLTRWSPARQAPDSRWKLSTSPGMPTCRWSDCDAPHSLICVSETGGALGPRLPASQGPSRRKLR